jgi:hypothetical protein
VENSDGVAVLAVPSLVYNWSINPFTNPNPVYSHTHTRDNILRETISVPTNNTGSRRASSIIIIIIIITTAMLRKIITLGVNNLSPTKM